MTPILITGGAGYIGSHLTQVLQQAGYLPLVLDNLSSGQKVSVPAHAKFFEGDMGDQTLIQKIYHDYPFPAVIHLAASIQTGESVQHPLMYYQNNVGRTLQLLMALQHLGIKKILFSSSASVYGEPNTNTPFTENCPASPVSPYGHSKWMLEQILQDLNRAQTIQAICLRYFNVAGAHPTFHTQQHATHLIPIILNAIKHKKPVAVFGNDYDTQDGTCIRDYIHVMDLCDAHLLALEFLLQETHPRSLTFNLGTHRGSSVLDIIKTAEIVTHTKIDIQYSARRTGDPRFLVADSTLARTQLNWTPHRSDPWNIIHDVWTYAPCHL
ncbi:MAG: UDP-glucose 4-epimerase GalE [Gammaproteobacteria bacterium]|nr:UDP-glucose 4-epimerase GalE [Gammaproteobacteria bacterium]